MDHFSIPLRAGNLYCASNSKTNPAVSKQRLRCTAINAKVEIEIGPILVGSRQSVLRAKGVSRGFSIHVSMLYRYQRHPCQRTWAQICNLNNNTVSSVGQLVTATVGFGGQLPACTAARAGTRAGANAEFVLRYGGRVAGL